MPPFPVNTQSGYLTYCQSRVGDSRAKVNYSRILNIKNFGAMKFVKIATLIYVLDYLYRNALNVYAFEIHIVQFVVFGM